MMRLARALVLVAFYVLASAARAEAAWLLWRELTFAGLPDFDPNPDWSLISATPDYEKCERELQWKARHLRRLYEDEDRSGSNVADVTVQQLGNLVTRTTQLKDGRTIYESSRLLCLPDTVDPRGAKGR